MRCVKYSLVKETEVLAMRGISAAQLIGVFGFALLGSSVSDASSDRTSPLIPIQPTAVLRGVHRSACEPMMLHGKPTYTRLALSFAGARYASSETLYSDPKCEISVMETTSQGTWKVTHRTVLDLRLTRMQMRPLDPRMADNLTNAKSCGKRWENGVPNEILGTACGRGRVAEYFVGQSPSGKSLRLYECEGRRTVGSGCTHYEMARTDAPAAAKSLKPLSSLRNSAKTVKSRKPVFFRP